MPTRRHALVGQAPPRRTGRGVDRGGERTTVGLNGVSDGRRRRVRVRLFRAFRTAVHLSGVGSSGSGGSTVLANGSVNVGAVFQATAVMGIATAAVGLRVVVGRAGERFVF